MKKEKLTMKKVHCVWNETVALLKSGNEKLYDTNYAHLEQSVPKNTAIRTVKNSLMNT